jgi:hypothetical protein
VRRLSAALKTFATIVGATLGGAAAFAAILTAIFKLMGIIP